MGAGVAAVEVAGVEVGSAAAAAPASTTAGVEVAAAPSAPAEVVAAGVPKKLNAGKAGCSTHSKQLDCQHICTGQYVRTQGGG